MKKLIIIALGLLTATTISVQAADGDRKKKEMTPEQQKVMKEITDKYDANKNGQPEPDEREKVSAEDREKMAKAGLSGGKKKKQ